LGTQALLEHARLLRLATSALFATNFYQMIQVYGCTQMPFRSKLTSSNGVRLPYFLAGPPVRSSPFNWKTDPDIMPKSEIDMPNRSIDMGFPPHEMRHLLRCTCFRMGCLSGSSETIQVAQMTGSQQPGHGMEAQRGLLNQWNG
jgi:hypothetical protein